MFRSFTRIAAALAVSEIYSSVDNAERAVDSIIALVQSEKIADPQMPRRGVAHARHAPRYNREPITIAHYEYPDA